MFSFPENGIYDTVYYGHQTIVPLFSPADLDSDSNSAYRGHNLKQTWAYFACV